MVIETARVVKKISGILTALVFLAGYPGLLALRPQQHTHSISSHTTRSNKSKSSSGKTEHVNGYYRKNGTYVHGYDRHPAGTAANSLSTPVPYRRDRIADGFTPDASVRRDKHGKIRRSTAPKHAFEHGHPCPSTGRNTGACPGYVIDHVRPLECGGADDPLNMQWQTVAEGKSKDKMERYCR